VASGLDELVARDAVRKLYSADGSLWSDEPEQAAKVGYWTGWLPVVAELRRESDELRRWATETMQGFERVVLCGMGGSSLAPLVFGQALGADRLHVLDTTDPDAVQAVPVDGSLFVVSSKSGTTLEPELMEAFFWERTGGDGARFVAVTDPGSQLAERAQARGFRRVFENRPDIGGRFSALSYFGLVPAALAGVDSSRLLDRAEQVVTASGPGTNPEANVPLGLGAALGDHVRAGRDKCTFVTSPGLGPIGLWLEQLLAESTGKNGTGVVPLADEPLGAPAVYGPDRFFAYLRLDGDGTHDAAVDALEGTGFPVTRCVLQDAYDIGAQMVTWEMATAYAGALIGINPFDQPNVQSAKDQTVALLEQYVAGGQLDPVDGGDLGEVLGGAVRGQHFVAILAFVTPDEATESALQAVRAEIRDRLGVATSLGFGPRYLHSTGQLHKGGPRTGRYLQVTSERDSDAPIPGRPYGFRVVIEAQARGDAKALRATGQPVVRVPLSRVADAVAEALR
jgi:glucose-6-phosphate isomerase